MTAPGLAALLLTCLAVISSTEPLRRRQESEVSVDSRFRRPIYNATRFNGVKSKREPSPSQVSKPNSRHLRKPPTDNRKRIRKIQPEKPPQPPVEKLKKPSVATQKGNVFKKPLTKNVTNDFVAERRGESVEGSPTKAAVGGLRRSQRAHRRQSDSEEVASKPTQPVTDVSQTSKAQNQNRDSSNDQKNMMQNNQTVGDVQSDFQAKNDSELLIKPARKTSLERKRFQPPPESYLPPNWGFDGGFRGAMPEPVTPFINTHWSEPEPFPYFHGESGPALFTHHPRLPWTVPEVPFTHFKDPREFPVFEQPQMVPPEPFWFPQPPQPDFMWPQETVHVGPSRRKAGKATKKAVKSTTTTTTTTTTTAAPTSIASTTVGATAAAISLTSASTALQGDKTFEAIHDLLVKHEEELQSEKDPKKRAEAGKGLAEVIKTYGPEIDQALKKL
ncbi:unnamed protein product [Mesocestoides corti]|uniref:DUF148 domain-containing protein n=1 Tax=Mesocestoides corti TaxID=53468 RepID=A0A0R3U5H7_MESCO|nr:unnamed protein product [Mesocestoides corti]